MNILFCTFAYYPAVTGGAERQARLQARELVRRGHHVTVVCPETDGLKSESFEGVRIIRLCRTERQPLTRISYFVRLLPWLLRHVGKFDIVHVHLANLQADLAVFAARRWGRPSYVKLACGGPVGEVRRLAKVAWLTRWYGYRKAGRVQALSEEIVDELTSIGVNRRQVVQIPNGIDLEELAPLDQSRRRQLREQLDLPPDGTLVLFVGRLAEYKGIGDLLEAWSREQYEATLVVVGATDDETVAPDPSVIVRDWVSSPKEYLQAADVFVHPTHADGMSNAVLEAMACGLPIVATEHGATRGFMEDGREALLVPVRDPDALAAALRRMVSDPALRRRLGSAARDSARRYEIPGIVDRIEAEYLTLVATAPRRRVRAGLRWSLRAR